MISRNIAFSKFLSKRKITGCLTEPKTESKEEHSFPSTAAKDYYLALTRLKLKSLRYIVPFMIYSCNVVRQIQASEGFLKGKVLGTPSLSMWTATLWDSPEALRKFYLSGKHREVASKISEWSSEGVSGHLQVEDERLPSWEEISIQLSAIGRFHTVEEPSENQINKIIPQPRVTIGTIFLTARS